MFNRLADLLVNARNSDEDRGANFIHGPRKLVELGTVGDLCVVVVHHVIERAGGDVRQGKERDAGVGFVEAEFASGQILIGRDIGVREHHAFGLAGGARGVDEGSEIAGLDGTDEGIEDRIAIGARIVGPGKDLGESDGSLGGFGVHHEDALEGCPGADGVQFFELLTGRDDGDTATGVGEQDGDLVTGKRGIDGNVDAIDGQDGEVGDCPFPAIFRNQGDAVAFFCTPGKEGLREGVDALVDLVGGERLPVAELVLPEDGAGICSCGHTAKEVVDCREGRRHHVGCFVLPISLN